MNQNSSKSEDGLDVAWMLLSFLSLSAKYQVELIEPIPRRGGVTVLDLKKNSALQLLVVIDNYEIAWSEEFEPSDKNWLELHQVARNIFDQALHHGKEVATQEAFMTSEAWETLRVLARKSLEEVGLGALRLTTKIDFTKYTEMVSEEDL